MLRLTLTDASGVQHDMDLFENDPVNLNIQFTDITDINKPVGSHTQAFRLPMTQPNKAFLGAINHPSVALDSNGRVSGRYAPKKRIPAELTFKGLPILRGNAQVKAVYEHKGRYHEVEVVVFGEAIQLANLLQGKRLRDLTMPTIFDADLTSGYLPTAAQTGVYQVASGFPRMILGVVDRGQNWDNNAGTYWSSSNRLKAADLMPFFELRSVLEAIMTDAGLTLDSTWADSATMRDVFLMGMPDTQQSRGDAIEDASFRVLGTGQNNIDDAVISWTESGGFDTGNNFSGGRFTCPIAGQYTFRVSVARSGAEDVWGGFVHLRKNSDGTANYQQNTHLATAQLPTFAPDVTLQSNTVTAFEWSGLLDAGDELDVVISQFGILNTTASSNITNVSFWELISLDPAGNYSINAALNLPDESQLEFLTGLQRMFNLVFVTDPADPTRVKIEPYDDYVGTGDTLDWTRKVDLDKDLVLRPATDLQAREYEWTFSEGKDLVNLTFQGAGGRVYGRHRLLDPENDFATGTKVVKSTMAAGISSLIPGTDVVIPRMLDDKGAMVNDKKCRLFFHNGSQDADVPFQRVSASNTVVNSTLAQIHRFSPYESAAPTLLDDTLLYGPDTQLVPVGVNPLNTLYYKRWRNLVYDLYSDEARVMTCHMRLSAADIAAFDFTKLIWVKDARWRVVSINGFQPNGDSTCKVTLLMDITAPETDCLFTPSALQTGTNIVTFTDADGNTGLAGSKLCCEQYGYSWNGTSCSSAAIMDPDFRSSYRTQLPTGAGMETNVTGLDQLVLGDSNQVGGSQMIVVGSNNDLLKAATGSVVVGRGHGESDIPVESSALFGYSGKLWSKGLHVSAATNDDGSGNRGNQHTDLIGHHMGGMQIWSFKGSVAGNGRQAMHLSGVSETQSIASGAVLAGKLLVSVQQTGSTFAQTNSRMFEANVIITHSASGGSTAAVLGTRTGEGVATAWDIDVNTTSNNQGYGFRIKNTGARIAYARVTLLFQYVKSE